MEKIPFDRVQQFMIPPRAFLNLIFKAGEKGNKPNLNLNVELDEEDQEAFEEVVNKFRRSPNEGNFEALKDELFKLEEEYFAFPNSMSFLSNGERVVLQTNGILFVGEKSFHIVDDMIAQYH